MTLNPSPTALSRQTIDEVHPDIRPNDDPQWLREMWGIRFHHFYDLTGRLVGTIATEPSMDEGEVEGEYVLVAAAIVSKKDEPSRALGRRIALARLEAGKYVALPLADLKREIAQRTILRHFAGGGRLALRPRRPFVEDRAPHMDDAKQAAFDEVTVVSRRSPR